MFELSNENKILLLILLVGVVLYLLSGSNKTEPIHNEGMLTYDPKLSNNFNDIIDTEIGNDSVDTTSNMSNTSSNSSNSDDVRNVTEKVTDKIDEYKSSSYNKGDRSAKSASLDSFFEGNYPKKSDNNGFAPMVENDGKYAAYTSSKTKKLSDKEKFDPNSLLPREKNTEWFDDPYEQTTVKSSHLINIYRPTSVTTVQTTKARTLDIRGVPANPKYPVSPFGNSSWEADNNISTSALC